MTLIIAIILLFVKLQPQDGGNHPRKEEMKSPVTTQRGFHPPKEWDI